MADKTTSIPAINMSNSKKEMLNVIDELKNRLQEKAEQELNPEKKIQEKKAREVIEVADATITDSVTKDINNLKADIGTMLNQLAEKLEETTAQYQRIKQAVDLKQQELTEIYEIEKSAQTLAALIEAQNVKKWEFDAEMEVKKKSLLDEIGQTKQQWDREKQEYEVFIKERDAAEKKARTREIEEYDYTFKRKQEIEKNRLKDELDKLHKELSLRKEEFEKETTARESNLDERENTLRERETIMDELQKKVEAFPHELDAKVTQAVKEITTRLKDEATRNEAFIKAEAEGEKRVLATRIDSLEKMVKEQNKQIESLSAQLENSYGKIQEIALKTVEGSSNRQTINSIEQLLEKTRKSQIENKNQ